MDRSRMKYHTIQRPIMNIFLFDQPAYFLNNLMLKTKKAACQNVIEHIQMPLSNKQAPNPHIMKKRVKIIIKKVII